MLRLKNILIILFVVLITCSVSLAVDIEALISSMTLDEKVGQMTQLERSVASVDDVRNYFIGSILSGGGSHPASNTPTGWADMHDDYQNAALSTRLGIPIIYGIDAVHGHNNVYGATIFPHNIGLGAACDPILVEEIGRITAKEVRCTGLEWTFGPCVTVPRDERWGRTYEGFGEDPELQTLLAGSYVKGFQGTTMSGERIIACAKHYVGDGGTTGGDDRGDTVCDETTLRNIHMPGYIEALNNNVGTIMPSFSSWNGVKMHEHTYLLTDVLKTELAFDGFLISDWEAINELSGATYYDDVVLAVNAGIDMCMEPSRNWQEWITNVKNAVNAGDISMTRIDDAVRRILRIKDRSGVFENPLADRTLVESGALGCAEHRAVAREAVRKSLVLLKNDGILPLSKASSVFVAGRLADDIGLQCGGWTIDWQGGYGDITPGTTVLEGIQDAVAAGGGSVIYDERGRGSAGHDVAIVVIGERPYAEGNGDDSDLALDGGDVRCLGNIDPAVPIVVVLISGRPLMVSDHINNWNALVAAWLPGTEGNGIADVLFGDYDFTGKLPHTWPRDITQIPINNGDSPYDPLFAYGFGLDYGSTSYCGDATCDPGEDQCNCPDDCGTPPATETICDDGIDEDCDTYTDCDDSDCLGDPACPSCGDETCDSGEDQCNCPDDCGTPPSTETNCTDGIDEDCDLDTDCDDLDCDTDPACIDPYCGDDTCDTGEDQCNCPDDCGTPPSTETSCTDEVDNDCDTYTDCDDSDCDGDPACPDCLPKGAACTEDAECCSGNCLPAGKCR